MTTQERLNKRIELLTDLHCQVDEVNGMIYVIYNRRLDIPITFLKHLTKSRFTALLDDVAEAFTKYHDK